MKFNPVVSALALVLGCGVNPVQAQTQSDDELRSEIRQMREELRQLHKEVDTLKGRDVAKADGAELQQLHSDVDTLKTRVAIEAKQLSAFGAPDPRIRPRSVAPAVVPESAIPGGMVIPGTTTSVHLYGFAEMDAIHDFRQSSSPDIFSDLTNQPLNNAGGQTGKTQFTAETSRLGFASSTPTPDGPLTTTIESDFYSYGGDKRNLVRLRHAYGEYNGWLVGQTWSTFMDVDDLPETVDFNGPIGAPFSRRAQVRYAFGDATKAVRMTLAVEDPVDQSGGTSANEKLPEFVARIDKTFAWGALNLRVLEHEKRSDSETRHGYGFGVGGSFKLSAKDLLMAQFTRVAGDVDQLYGSNGYAINPGSGNISFDHNKGLVLGYAHVFSDKLRSNASFGMNQGQSAAAVNNRSLKETFFNLIYTPIKNIDLGAEWMYGQRETFAGETGTLSRIDLMGRYSF
ncbi:hypothetical protein AAKU67_002683 [Oxalobacteraceae bacterium GrIS 2.11]